MTSANELLNKTLVCDIAQTNVTATRSDDRITAALSMMITGRISSVPMFSVEENRFSCFVDVLDVVSFLVDLGEVQDVSVLQEKFCASTNAEVKGNHGSNWSGAFIDKLNEADTLKRAINIMTYMVNIHRLPIFTLSGDLVGILSQSDIIHTLAPHIGLFSISNKLLKEIGLGLGRKDVICVTEDATLREAFSKMKEHNISGLAVVDNQGFLVSSVSAQDVKILGENAERLQALNQPIRECFPERRRIVAAVTPDCSVRKVFERFHNERLYRLFITEDMHVIGIITQIDLLDLLSKHI